MAGLTASAVIASIVAAVPSYAAGPTPAVAASTPSADPRIAALAKAKTTGSSVPVDALTSTDSVTVANPDGTLTATTTIQPTRMKNSAGSWVGLDATLTRTTAGTVAPAVTPDSITLSPGGTGPLITVADHAGHAMALTLPLTLPAPSISGPSATYTSIYPGLDLTVTVTTTGSFSEVLTVHDAAALAFAKDLKFTTGLTGLTLAPDAAGNLNAIDPTTGAIVMNAPPAALWDSATATAPQGTSRTAKTATNTTAAAQPAADNGIFGQATSTTRGPGIDAHVAPLGITVTPGSLTLNADTTSLGSNPDFPLFLDPQWAAPVVGGTQAWTEVQSGCPAALYYNNITQPGVGYNSSSGCIGVERAYYQVDTSGVLNSTYDILSSTLKTTEVYSTYNSCGQSSENVSVYLAGTITTTTDWKNQPGPIGGAIATQNVETVGNTSGTMCSGSIVSTNFNVLPLIADARNGGWPNVTFSLEGNESASSSSSLERFSDNPTITTNYDIPPGAPTNFSVSPTLVNAAAAASVNGCAGNTEGTASGGGGGYLSISNMAGKNAAVLSAYLPSNQTGAQLYAQFSLYNHAKNVWVQAPGINNPTPVGPNEKASYTTPPLEDNTCYSWDVTSTDLIENSPGFNPAPWSSFFTDFKPPTNPVITSSSFPTLASGAASPTKAGQQGSFTLSATDAGSGIKGYYYSIDNSVPSNSGALQTSTTVTYTAPLTSWGAHTLYAQSQDNAGNLSAVSSYSFYVPWNPSAAVKPGDINDDGIPDLVSTDISGDLTLVPGNSNPNATATVISLPTDSPDGTSWANFDATHDGSYEGKGVDDLWSFNASTHSLYLYQNSGTGTFKNPNANNTDVTMQKVGIDVNGAAPTQIQNACVDPTSDDSTGPTCANFDYSDWNNVQQILAPGDLYAHDPVTSGLYNGVIVDNGVSGLLTADTDGSLWYFNGQTTQNYLNAAVQLGTAGWNGTTLIGSDTIGSTTYLWARLNSTGAIYQYPITFDAHGNLINLGTPTSGAGTQLTIPGSDNILPAAAYPQLYAQNLHATGYADLIATTPTGAIIDWPGTASSGTTAAFTNPKAIGGAVMTLTNVAMNVCLDSNYAGNLYSGACNGGYYQAWIVTPNNDGTWTLTDYQTGLCLDGNGSWFYVDACNGGSYQHWTPTWGGSGWILTSLATGMVIDDNGSPYFNTLNGGPYQQWK